MGKVDRTYNEWMAEFVHDKGRACAICGNPVIDNDAAEFGWAVSYSIVGESDIAPMKWSFHKSCAPLLMDATSDRIMDYYEPASQAA